MGRLVVAAVMRLSARFAVARRSERPLAGMVGAVMAKGCRTLGFIWRRGKRLGGDAGTEIAVSAGAVGQGRNPMGLAVRRRDLQPLRPKLGRLAHPHPPAQPRALKARCRDLLPAER